MTDLRREQCLTAEELARAEELLASHTWWVAKTMPQWPHEYTLRRTWENQEDFVWMVTIMREKGYYETWGRRVSRVMNVSGFKLWTMESPVDQTKLINRKRLPAPVA